MAEPITAFDDQWLPLVCRSHVGSLPYTDMVHTILVMQLSLGSAMNNQLLYRAEELQELLGLSRSKIYEMMASGDLPTVRFETLCQGASGCACRY